MEPYKLRRWKAKYEPGRLSFYTCARPGRSKGASHQVDDEVVCKWAEGLPREDEESGLAVVSLLGRKPDGTSEYSFYTFYGGWDDSEEHKGKRTFGERLDEILPDREIKVVERPTQDFKGVPQEILEAVKSDVNSLLQQGMTVVLVDSGGETRSEAVCKYLDFVEDSRTL